MDNDPIQRGQNDGPHWGPPAKRAAATKAPSQETVNSAAQPLPVPDGALADPPPPNVPLQPQPLPPPAPWQQPKAKGQSTRMRPSATVALGQIGRASWWLVAGTLTASVLLELALRTRLNSLATLLAALVVSALIVSSAQRRRPAVAAAVGLAIVGAGIAVLRASLWVTAPTLLMAGSCLVLASQGRLLTGRIPAAVSRYLGDAALSVRWLLDPLKARQGRSVTSLGRSVALAAVAVIPLALLLASADAAFSALLTSVGPGQSWQHAALTALILPFVAAITLAARRPDQTAAGQAGGLGTGPGSAVGGARTPGLALSMADATVVLGSVGVLLAVWGATQAVVALGGAQRLLATTNLTAAENARQGFFQLVAATAFLVGVIVVVDRFTGRTSASDRARFLGFTVLIGLETFGVVAATYARLALYISGFGNTMLRTSVAWFLAWLAAVMLVLVISVNRTNGKRWRGTVLFGSAALWVVAFGLSNPESVVARGNLARSEQAVDVDYRYLGTGLGPDAIPALVEQLPTLAVDQQEQLTEDLCRQADSLGSGYQIFSWNRSHAKAAAALESLGC